jgi:hypothetical protein
MHGNPEKPMSEVRIERPELAPSKSVRVYPTRCSAATERDPVLGLKFRQK